MPNATYAALQRVGTTLVHEPRKINDAARGAARIGNIIVRNPTELRHVGRWVGSLRRSTLDLRLPWLPFNAIEVLERRLDSSSRVFEFGGGGSTLWFADRVGEVVTAEHDPGWTSVLAEHTALLPNVTLLARSSADEYATYVTAIAGYPDEYFDVVVVDGRERVRCFEHAMPKVRPGGLLVLDDSQRPKYAKAFTLAQAWRAATFQGLTPTKSMRGTTTAWLRPAST